MIIHTTSFCLCVPVNAIFLFQYPNSVASSVSVYACILSAPVSLVFPYLFQRAAYWIDCEKKETEFLATFSIVVLIRNRVSRGWQLLTVSGFVLGAWTAICIFATLVFTMNLDWKMRTHPTTVVWVNCCLYSLVEDIFILSPILCIIKTYLFAMQARYFLHEFQVSVSDCSSEVSGTKSIVVNLIFVVFFIIIILISIIVSLCQGIRCDL